MWRGPSVWWKMCGTIFSNFSMQNLRIARMVRAELNVVRALRFRRGRDWRGCNNCVHTRAHMSAIYVTEIDWCCFYYFVRNSLVALLETRCTRTYYLSVCIWFQEWAHLGPESTVPVHPQLRPFTLQLFLDFCAIFLPEWPLMFWVIMIHQVIWRVPVPSTRRGRNQNKF